MTTLSKPQHESSISPQEIKPKPRYSAEFKTKSKKAQRLFAASLLKCPGNIAGWVKYDLAEKNFTLLCTLANSIYGLPPQPEKPSTSSSPPLPQEWNPPRDQSTASKSYELYSEGQQKVVETVYNAIESNCGESKSIEMSRILLYLLLEGDCIVEREIFEVRFPNISGKFSRALEKIVPRKNKPEYLVNYVCYEGRVYSTWQYFLETNRLPKCYYAYPRDGFYPQESWIQLDFAYSPACSLLNVVVPYVDKFSTGVNVCATANVLIGGVAVPVIAFLGVTIVITGPAAIVLGVGGTALTYGAYGAALYSTVKCGVGLVGRYRHGESLSLRDRKNRHVWLSFVSGSLGLVGSVGIGYLLTPIIARKVYMAQSGTVTIFQRIAYDACVYTRLLFSFASLLDMLEELVSSGRKPTRMELLQMSVSIFFLTKSLVTFQTCTGLIRSLQDERFQSALAGKSSHAQEVLKATRARVRGLMPFNPEESGNTMVRVVNIGEEKPEVLEMYIDQFAEFLKMNESEIQIVTTHSGSYDLPTTTEGIDLLVYSDGTTTTHHVDSQSQRTIKAVLDFRNMRFQKLDRTDTIEMHTVVKSQNKTYLWFDKQYRDTDTDQYRSYDQNTYFVDLNGQGYAVHNHIADKWQISHYHHHWESENFALDLALSALKSAIISWGNPGAIFIGIWATMANYMASKLDDPALRFCLNFVSSVVSAAALDCNAAANSAANLATNSAGSALVTKEFFTRALVKNCIILGGKTMAQLNPDPSAQFAVNVVTDIGGLCMGSQKVNATILATTVGSDAAFTLAHNTDNEAARLFCTAAGTVLNSASQYEQQGKSGLNVFTGPAVAGNLGKSVINYAADKIAVECGAGSPEAQFAGMLQVVANSGIDTQVAIVEDRIELQRLEHEMREALQSLEPQPHSIPQNDDDFLTTQSDTVTIEYKYNSAQNDPYTCDTPDTDATNRIPEIAGNIDPMDSENRSDLSSLTRPLAVLPMMDRSKAPRHKFRTKFHPSRTRVIEIDVTSRNNNKEVTTKKIFAVDNHRHPTGEKPRKNTSNHLSPPGDSAHCHCTPNFDKHRRIPMKTYKAFKKTADFGKSIKESKIPKAVSKFSSKALPALTAVTVLMDANDLYKAHQHGHTTETAIQIGASWGGAIAGSIYGLRACGPWCGLAGSVIGGLGADKLATNAIEAWKNNTNAGTGASWGAYAGGSVGLALCGPVCGQVGSAIGGLVADKLGTKAIEGWKNNTNAGTGASLGGAYAGGIVGTALCGPVCGVAGSAIGGIGADKLATKAIEVWKNNTNAGKEPCTSCQKR